MSDNTYRTGLFTQVFGALSFFAVPYTTLIKRLHEDNRGTVVGEVSEDSSGQRRRDYGTRARRDYSTRPKRALRGK